ncbi:hypothetical protein LTR62_002557 [Meristemomyces frigidus]|uniref:Nucleoporin Nup159/Nup146 N-terminal domain-containing protein n=1 Tax=Meristemomyces frigidus TaxID=1508187 RepID=A0AAN7YQ43_9PEZI|nr:hypothetical protein LTR62_002557 [Meristemomyces frigidus]
MSGFGGGGGVQAVQGDDLQGIESEQLNFIHISSDTNLRLLPSSWPDEQLPPSSASLLSIASNKGLVAAAGPDTLVVFRTETLRNTFRDPQVKAGSDKNKSYTPEAVISIPRVSQVAFSSDESCLVIAAEQGGGLAVYDTNALTDGSKEPAFQIGTKGVSVRQLLPNPNPSPETALLFGIVLETGQLLLANLRTHELVNSSRGDPVFHQNVASACWSRLGKQIVAGRADGTAVQIDPKGDVKAEIPLPPRLPELAAAGASPMPLMSIYWLDTNEFLLIHTPVVQPGVVQPDSMDSSSPVNSFFHIATRENAKSQVWLFRTIEDPSPPGFSPGRSPPHHYIQRLKDWPPHLDDLLVIISTVTTEVGVLSKASKPLAPDAPVAAFNMTSNYKVPATMPMSAAGQDTFALGMALDLSVTERTISPIPGDNEVAESPTPLPALYVLNSEGVLRVWYIAYKDSIRQKIAFPDLVAANGPRALDAKATTPITPTPALFGTSAAPLQPSFGNVSKPQTPSNSSFGQPSNTAFGGSSTMGQKSSLWGAPPAASSALPLQPAASQPTFGSSTPSANSTGFGQIGGMGAKASPWAAKGSAATQPSATFGQPSNILGQNPAPPESSFATTVQSSKQSEANRAANPFAGGGKSLASFGAIGAQGAENKSPFAALQKTPTFGTQQLSFGGETASLGNSSFGSGKTPSLFGTPTPSGSGLSIGTFGKPSLPASREESMNGTEEQQKPSAGGGLFGTGSFKLGSTFKPDGTAKDDLPKPKTGLFDWGLGKTLDEPKEKKVGEQPTTPIKAEPGTVKETPLRDVPAVGQSSTPAGLPAPKTQDNDPLSYKAKRFAGDLPPMEVPGGDEPATEKDQPKIGQKKAEVSQKEEQALAGSPPIDLGHEQFSAEALAEIAGPEEDEDEEWSEEDEGEEEEEEEGGVEGDEEDESEDEDEEEDESDHEVADPKGLSAFEGRMQPASPDLAKATEESTTPATEKKAVPSFTPAGLPKGPVFAPPMHASPRSPSPVRSVTAPLQQRPTFGQLPAEISGTGAVPSTLKRPSVTSHTSDSRPASRQQQQQPSQRIAIPVAKFAERSTSPASEPDARSKTGALEDEEAVRVQERLASTPEPTTDLPSFLAHQDYVGPSSGVGDLSSSIEKLFRDVNSMIDTLGLNAHWLRGFVDGHEKLKKQGERSREDLEDEREWTLDEVQALGKVEDEVGSLLEQGRIRDVGNLLSEVGEVEGDVRGLRSKAGEMRKVLKRLTDPEQKAADAKAALPEETLMLQKELRSSVQNVQTLLGKVEEGLSVLRAEVASASATSLSAPAPGQGKGAVPSVEAVTNTILKMTAMIEKKSGDVDLLEARIRRLPGGIASLDLDNDYEDQLVSSLTGSRLLETSTSTPRSHPTNRHSRRMLANGDAPGMNGMLASRYTRTPPSTTSLRQSAMFSPEQSRLRSSVGPHSAVKKRMVDVSEQEVQVWRGKKERRRTVAQALRDEVEQREGGRVVRLQG